MPHNTDVTLIHDVLCCALLSQVAVRPSDVEALRLLGESRLLNAEPAKSVAAYETAIALAPNDQSLITVCVFDCGAEQTSYCAAAGNFYIIVIALSMRNDKVHIGFL
jgi:hypothetical protein